MSEEEIGDASEKSANALSRRSLELMSGMTALLDPFVRERDGFERELENMRIIYNEKNEKLNKALSLLKLAKHHLKSQHQKFEVLLESFKKILTLVDKAATVVSSIDKDEILTSDYDISRGDPVKELIDEIEGLFPPSSSSQLQ